MRDTDALGDLLLHGWGRFRKEPGGRRTLTKTFTPARNETADALLARVAVEQGPDDTVEVVVRNNHVAQVDLIRSL